MRTEEYIPCREVTGRFYSCPGKISFVGYTGALNLPLYSCDICRAGIRAPEEPELVYREGGGVLRERPIRVLHRLENVIEYFVSAENYVGKYV